MHKYFRHTLKSNLRLLNALNLDTMRISVCKKCDIYKQLNYL